MLILDAMPLAVAVVDTNGQISYTNRQFRHWLGADWAGQTWEAALARLPLVDGQPHVRRLGDLYLHHTQRRLDSGDQLEMLEDVSAAQAQDEALRTLFLVWDEAAAHQAHEIRNPLTAILGYGTLLRDRPNATEERRRDWAAHTVEKGQAIRDLLVRYSDTSRFMAERHRFTRAALDLDRLVEETVAEVRDRSGRRIEVQTETATVTGDEARLSQMLTQLLDNAVAYSPDDTSIRVSLTRDESHATLQVADDGPGIPPERLLSLVEPLVRGQVNGHMPRGSGLGLTIARGIAAAHDGELHIESVPGQGSVFSVILPLSLAI